MTKLRAHRIGVLLPILLIACMCGGSTAEEAWRRDLDHQERMRVASLIRDLDTAYVLRRDVVRSLVALGKGPSAEMVRFQLIQALERDNMQIRQAAAEVMARIGDPEYARALLRLLPREPFGDNRVLLMRILPSFLVQDPALRRELLEVLYSHQRVMTDRLRAVLREPPLRPGGRGLDLELARLRAAIVEGLAGQLDPIGSAIPWFDHKEHDAVVRRWVLERIREELEGSRDACRERWDYIRTTARLRDPLSVEQLQETAAVTLGDMGAFEATEALLALGAVERPNARQIALRGLADLARFAHRRWSVNGDLLAGGRLTARDVLDRDAFYMALRGVAPDVSAAVARIGRALPAALRERLAAHVPGDPPDPDLLPAVLAGVNDVLVRPTLFRTGEVERLPPTAREVFDARTEGLPPSQAVRLNRLLLERALPGVLRRRLPVRRDLLWREVGLREAEWRRDERRACRAAALAARRLGATALADPWSRASEDVRAEAYAALGASRRRGAAPLLGRYAYDAGLEPHPRRRADIARALGAIGGEAAVEILGRLAVYKGYATTALARQDEYRVVCTALEALARIASRPGDSGAEAAIAEFDRALADTRVIPELPDLPPFSDQALTALRTAFQAESLSRDPAVWRRIQAEHLRARAAEPRPVIPHPETPADPGE